MVNNCINIIIIAILVIFAAMTTSNFFNKTCKNYEEKIQILESKNYELTRACELSDTLRQLIPPQAWDELQVVAEESKQRREKNNS